MELLRYPITQNRSVNLWWTTEVCKEAVVTQCEAFSEEVNLTEGYVQIIYPVRKAFLKDHSLASVAYPTEEFPNLRFPFENNRLDFSTFIHTPHHLRVYAKTWIEVEQDAIYPFDLYTCGALKLWVDGQEQMSFAPFTRNIAQKQHIELDLNKGRHEVVVFAEELAERDVFFYIELRYKGFHTIHNVVQIPSHARELQQAMQVLTSLCYSQDRFEEGEVIVCYNPEYVTQPTTLRLKNSKAVLHLSSDSDRIILGKVEDFQGGVHRHTYQLSVGPYLLERDLLVQFSPRKQRIRYPKPTLEGRKEQALQAIKKMGEHAITTALVICETEQRLTKEARRMVLSSLEKIERREDCSDFHLVPLLLLASRYAELLDQALLMRVKQAIINYRYWMDEPGNDVMWWFSENHAFLFHIGQYLGGYRHQNERFSASNRLGIEQYELGKQRLFTWFETFFAYGYAEWNSATYLPIDLIGLFVLHELAPDDDIKELATKALDFTFRLIAHNSREGVMSCSFGRCYEDTVKFRDNTELTFLNLIAFGKGVVTQSHRAVSLFALCSYTPPCDAGEPRLTEKQWMEIGLKQGIRGVNTYLFRTPFYQMGCVQRYRPFEHGHQQHLFNVAAGRHAQLQYFINHPGEPAFSGQNRPSYWAGNGTMPAIHQYKNLAVLLFKIDEEELVHAIHAYLPLQHFDAFQQSEHHLLFSCDDAYVSTYFSEPFSITQSGANSRREVFSTGLVHAVVVRCASKAEFGCFNRFISDQTSQAYVFDRQNMTITFSDSRWGLVEAGSDYLMVNRQTIPCDYPRTAAIQTGEFEHA